MGQTVIKESDNGRNVALAMGDKVRIELPEIPGAGFLWQLAAADQKVVRLEDFKLPPTAPPDALRGAVGGSRIHIFRGVAVGRGSTHIRLEFKRPWEASPPKSTFEIQVSVN